ncbi:MAG: SPFH domain-containing protein [Planctomycetaceae bacterium]
MNGESSEQPADLKSVQNPEPGSGVSASDDLIRSGSGSVSSSRRHHVTLVIATLAIAGIAIVEHGGIRLWRSSSATVTLTIAFAFAYIALFACEQRVPKKARSILVPGFWALALLTLIVCASNTPGLQTNVVPVPVWFLLFAVGGGLEVMRQVARASADRHIRTVSSESGTLRELQILTLICAVVAAIDLNESQFIRILSVLVRWYVIAIGFEGILRIAFAAITKNSLADLLSGTFLIRQLVSGKLNNAQPSAVPQATASINVRRSVAVGFMMTGVIAWLATGISMVSQSEAALYFRNGHLQAEPLRPGLHWLLPAPFSRVTKIPLKQIRAITIGYVLDEDALSHQKYLWTMPHGEQETPIIIGNGTEVVAVNAVVQFRPSSRSDELFNYAMIADQSDQIVRQVAMHVLLEHSRSTALIDLLTVDRISLGQTLHSGLQAELKRLKTGIDVTAFDVISIHPPVEIADAFLEIIDAKVRAVAEVADARGAHETELTRSTMMADTAIADASAAASVRLTGVSQEVAQLEQLFALDQKFPQVFRRRAYCDVLSEALAERTFLWISEDVAARLRLLPPNTDGRENGTP